MGVLPDFMIRALGCITPYHRGPKVPGVISFGESSAGYDISLGNQYLIFSNTCAVLVDPKSFDKSNFVPHEGDHCIIPPNSFVLAESVEYFEIPRDCIGLVLAKSTYARCGICTNFTPLEPCMSPDTDVLTATGWVPIADVQIGHQVLTRREDGVAEYRGVAAKQERYHRGAMLHFNGRSVDQLVTPDHKLFVLRRNSQTNVERPLLLPAAEVFGRYNYSFDRRVNWLGTEPGQYVKIGEQSFPTTAFMEFLGCWLGDGSAYLGNDGGYHVKLAVVTKDAKREYFQDVLTRMGIKAALRERGFEFYSKDLVLYLSQFGHARNKHIDRRFLNFPPAYLRLLLRGLINSDGNQETQTFTTASPQLADDVQEAAFKAGLGAIVRRVEARVFGKMLTAYKVRLCQDHMTPKVQPPRHVEHAYDGLVYDLTVPNHVFFCRRQGKASWTGNCWRGKITVEIANTTPLPAKVYSGEGIAQVLFLRLEAPPEKDYDQKGGNYQDQTGMTMPRVA
jgi:deoxycytidine triphosphate deaminase